MMHITCYILWPASEGFNVFRLLLCNFTIKESCARILLYRGANKDTKNNSGQNSFQVIMRHLQVFVWVFSALHIINRLKLNKLLPTLCMQFEVNL